MKSQLSNLSLCTNGDCLNTIRLIAVLQVIFGHTTRWLEIPYSEIVYHILKIFQGVPVFFMMSGFLIWFSIERSKSFKEYALKRFWRLYPELWVAVLFEVVVIVVIYDHSIEWINLVLFAVSEGTIPYWVPDFLNDYGTGRPNGALWTIFCLIKFYIIGYFIHKWMKGKSLFAWSLLLMCLIFGGIFCGYVNTHFPPIIRLLYNQSTIPFLWLFVLGIFVAERWNQGAKDLILKYWPLAFLVTVFVEFTGFDINGSDPDYGYSLIRCLSTLVWFLGFAYTFPQLNIKTDISYALFLYHMTIVQILYVYGYMHNPVYILVVIIVSVILSFISTKLVGEWSKRRKYKIAHS